jgi:CheY-like chemotaxis protein
MPSLKANLLVVDDEAPVRMCLLGILVESGYAVRTASDGFSALAAIRQRIPDLILSDLNMPACLALSCSRSSGAAFPPFASSP